GRYAALAPHQNRCGAHRHGVARSLASGCCPGAAPHALPARVGRKAGGDAEFPARRLAERSPRRAVARWPSVARARVAIRQNRRCG
nr:hypothetical protein [Tanacetum cinerariifolium]